MNSGLVPGLSTAPFKTQYLRVGSRAARGIVLGSGRATGIAAIAVGSGTASGAGSIALGGGTASGSGSFAAYGTASGLGAISFGSAGGVASGEGSFSIYNNTASGRGSVAMGFGSSATGPECVAFGTGCDATGGQSSFAIGRNCTASAASSTASGFQALADRIGMKSHSESQFSIRGDAQSVLFVVRNKTIDNTLTSLKMQQFGSNANITIPSGKVLSFIAQITGIKSDGTAVAKYIREGTIKNVGGVTSLAGSIITLGTDHEDNADTDVSITADDTSDALIINVTGITGETWRWVAVINGVEVGYGT